jgi:hypothetical protein
MLLINVWPTYDQIEYDLSVRSEVGLIIFFISGVGLLVLRPLLAYCFFPVALQPLPGLGLLFRFRKFYTHNVGLL